MSDPAGAVSPELLTDLYHEHHAFVRSVAARWVAREDVDDLTQQVWLRVFRSRTEFLSLAKRSSWLYRITLNTARDDFRRRRRRPWGYQEPIEAALELCDVGATPLSLALDAEKAQGIRAAVGALPPLYGDAMRLFLRGVTGADAARALGISRGALKSRIHRAKRMLEGC